MSISTKHPLYIEFLPDWSVMRDTAAGERVIKSKRDVYLPPTEGMLAKGMKEGTPNSPGVLAYESYLLRCLFPDIISDAVEALLGIMHHKPPTIELPAAMEPLREKATLRKESLPMLLRRINEEQLITGRLGLLADTVTGSTEPLPYIAMYRSETIINWDDGNRDGIAIDNLNLVVLDETEQERTSVFEWESKEKFRVLVLGDPEANEGVGDGAVYRQGVFRKESLDFSETALIEPSIRGASLDEIPFTFINAKDVVPAPENPPLLGLAKLVLAIYRGDADYRQSLFMQGQDTLVTVGGNDDATYAIGTGASINVPIGGDAKFIGVESSGLAEMRMSLENDNNRAMQKGGQLLDSVSRERESGDALRIRVAARTSSLNQIALAGAFGLQQTLRQIAKWIGANPEEVVVTANTDFIDDRLGGEELVKLLTAKSMGAPLSSRSIHKLEQDKGLTELSYEEELSEIDSEAPLFGEIEDSSGLTDDGPDAGTGDEDEEDA